jgi:lipoic acid synthetase/lipoate-protein ligase A
MENMVGSITPDDEKLRSHGVKSVRQRITLLKDYVDLSLDDFKKFVYDNLCDEYIHLTDDEVKMIREIEQEYLKPEFIYGK